MSTSSQVHPRRLSVKRDQLRIDGHDLFDVELGGWMCGPALGEAPVVLIVGGITANPFPFGNGSDKEAWWPSLQASDLVDPETMTILCPEWPGNGSNFRGIDDVNSNFHLSVQGLADLLQVWLEGIQCKQPITFVGASLGALVGFAMAQRYPDRVQRLVSISAGLRPDGWGTATRHVQRELVRDGLRNGDVDTGMARARQLGMLTYRGRHELDTRFGHLSASMAVPPVAEYLDYHGRRFARDFPVATFLLLSEAIDRCSFGETPAELRTAVEKVSAEVTVVGVPGDQLFPWELQEELHRELQAAGASSALWKLDSEFGHDAFLADQSRLAQLLRDSRALDQGRESTSERFCGVGVEPIREIRLGLIGCGVEGTGLLEIIDKQAEAVAERYAVSFKVTKMAVRDLDKDRGPLAADIPRTADALELVSDPNVDVVVEVAGGLAMEAPVRAALAAGKPVVTANKVLMAEKLAELGVLAQRTATPLFCEAAVAAAIPIIKHLSHRADEIDSLLGIVNGTCNYLLTRLEQDELEFEQALKEAQALGLAEADPSADVDGHDAAAKLSILAYRAFGTWVPPSKLKVIGIRDLKPADSYLAESLGFRIRHIAHAKRVGDRLDLAVEPLLLPSWHLLASVEEEYNAVYLQCASSGDLSLFGKGAGGLPTGTAILGDLIDLAQKNTMRWPEPRDIGIVPANELLRRHYLRVTAEPHPGLERRIDSLVRRAGLNVQARASRTEADYMHLGFLISESTDADFDAAQEAVTALGRVVDSLGLGVNE
ncbi:MAG: homoserine dehydrogenase [Kofleriaceae bacterium]|nr:homoserine dehydrogenase [Kofleriaceae bacterium]